MLNEMEYKSAYRRTTFGMILVLLLYFAGIASVSWKNSDLLQGLFEHLALWFAVALIALWWPNQIPFHYRKAASTGMFVGMLLISYLILIVVAFVPSFPSQ